MVLGADPAVALVVGEQLVAAHPERGLRGYARDLVERERRTPDLPGRETADRA
jgi:hypothetical protein